MGPWMTREYVTLRQEQRDGDTVWMETSVGRALLKSVPAKSRGKNGQYRIVGAAWGAPIQRVEVQIDGGPWLPATIDRSEEAEFAWKIWSLEWEKPAAGEHTIVSRAIDTLGNIQPTMEDPDRVVKHTRWESNGQFTWRIGHHLTCCGCGGVPALWSGGCPASLPCPAPNAGSQATASSSRDAPGRSTRGQQQRG